MPFRRNAVSYARFRVEGGPDVVTSELAESLAGNVLRPPPVGAPPELQAGWVAGRHVFDEDFHPEAILFGDHLLFGMRLDRNRVPAEIRRAYFAMAAAEKRDASALVDEKCRKEIAAGRHRQSKLVPVLWHVTRRLLLAPVFSDVVGQSLRELFTETFDARLEPLSAGSMAAAFLTARGSSRDYEDMTPSPFTPPPAAARADDDRPVDVPGVPWSPPGPEPKDFLGNEFLMWIWARTETDSAVIETAAGSVGVVIDRALDMDCAWDVTGRQTLRADGPTRLPEAHAALGLGKWPRKAGLIVAGPDGGEWTLTLQGDRFHVIGARVPAPPDPPESARVMTEYRVASVEAMDRTLVALFEAFLVARSRGDWRSQRDRMREWIKGRRAPRVVGEIAAGGMAVGEIIPTSA